MYILILIKSLYNLFKIVQVTVTLLRSIPKSETKGADLLAVVKHKLKQYFSRIDKDNKGVIGEDKFRGFLRKSGLHDVLATSEVRRLLAKFRRRVAIKDSGPRGKVMTDYERYIVIYINIIIKKILIGFYE